MQQPLRQLWFWVHVFQQALSFPLFNFPHRMHLCNLWEIREPMLSHLCAATQALSILWIAMAQVAGHEDREKTTALKGE